MKKHIPIFSVRLPRRLCLALLGGALLAGLTTRAESTICVELPVIAVKDVKGVAVAEAVQGGPPEEALPGVRVQLLRETAKGWTAVADAVTDVKGWFYIPNIKPGVYRIEGDLEGFSPAEGRLRVRRYFPVRRGTLVLVLPVPQIGDCDGWIELRKKEAEPRAIGLHNLVDAPDANRAAHGRRR